ncbi:hotdog fold thioesterase [Tengunoibacter tsumagoiensis]|uniref:Esterase n=1 Tax=Tengunoibacter tsumagoiensis TaxID=2014871 RepID=A0A401ZTP9_9CHLR|nr:hotdog fold thioesterase [Tengunoibacter tsumagoiensis]GCE10144.1 esterase [Tengunoibacter tsumagoiensis]
MELSQEEILARLAAISQGTAVEAMKITITEAFKDRVVATMPIEDQHRQIVGYLHGGVSVLLAETVASVASVLNIDIDRQLAFGLEINANHVRPKKDGVVRAIATPLHLGRTTHVWDIKIVDEQERLICVSRCTVAVVEKPAS